MIGIIVCNIRMGVIYPPANILLRQQILNTQPLFLKFLSLSSINILVHLFDENCLCKNRHYVRNKKQVHPTISHILQEERKKLKIKSNVTISSYVNKHKNKPGSSTLGLHVKKDGEDFIHLSIHLAPKKLDPAKEGILHFRKDIFTVKRSSRDIDMHYALIMVEQPNEDTLRFSIGYGYDTPLSPIATSAIDKELQNEMNAIINVLNKLFNPSDKYYINNSLNYPLIAANKTNILLSNMNKHTTIATRKNIKNKAYMHSQVLNNSHFDNINLPTYVLSRAHKVDRRKTRKLHIRRKYRNDNFNNININD